MNNNYQFRYDGSPEAKEAIKLLDISTSIHGWYYDNKGNGFSPKSSYCEEVTPAEFVSRLKGESDKCQQSEPKSHQDKICQCGYWNWEMCKNDIAKCRYCGRLYKLNPALLPLVDRIKHAYPSLSEKDVEQIVKMVKEERT